MAFPKLGLRKLRFLPLDSSLSKQGGAAPAFEGPVPEERPRTREMSAEEAALLALRTAVDQKALDIRVLKMSGVTDIADYFVICSGTSDRHVRGIADKIVEALKKVGDAPITASGLERSEWVLLDYGDVVVHVFYEPSRQFYNLDGLWSGAEELPMPEDLTNAARKLRTGLY